MKIVNGVWINTGENVSWDLDSPFEITTPYKKSIAYSVHILGNPECSFGVPEYDLIPDQQVECILYKFVQENTEYIADLLKIILPKEIMIKILKGE